MSWKYETTTLSTIYIYTGWRDLVLSPHTGYFVPHEQ